MRYIKLLASVMVIMMCSKGVAGQASGRQVQEIYEQPDEHVDTGAETKRHITDTMSCSEASSRVTKIFIDLSQVVIMGPINGLSNIPIKTERYGRKRLSMIFIKCGEKIDEANEAFLLTGHIDSALDKHLNTAPYAINNLLVRETEKDCNKGGLINHHIKKMKVDSYDASAAIVGCSSYIDGRPNSISYFVTIKAMRDLITMERTMTGFDPADPPIRPDRLPEMPWLKICDEKSSLTETVLECDNRNPR